MVEVGEGRVEGWARVSDIRGKVIDRIGLSSKILSDRFVPPVQGVSACNALDCARPALGSLSNDESSEK